MKRLTYKDAGVDRKIGDDIAEKIAAMAKTTYGPEVISGVGGFAGLYSLKPALDRMYREDENMFRQRQWNKVKARHVAEAKLPEDEKKRKLRELETAAWRATYEFEQFKQRTCWGSVRLECMKELGFALLCFQFLDADVDWGKQPGRVKKLCEELAREVANPELVYWNGLLDRIHEEIENLC